MADGKCRPAQDAARPQAKVHLRLAQKFYFARLQELKSSIAAYEQRFTTLMSEIAAVKSGSMDKTIKDEIRGVLARKFGKRLLDSWVPDEDAVKEAVEAGPPPSEEQQKEEPKPEQAAEEEVAAEAQPAVPSAEEVAEIDTTEQLGEEAGEVVKNGEAEEPAVTTPLRDAGETVDVEMAESPPILFSPVKDRVPTPFPTEPSSSSPSRPAPSSPASDFTPPPDDKTGQVSPSKAKDEEAPATATSTRASKRKASTQPRGAPTTKRSTRRKTSATPAAAEVEQPVEAAVDEAEADADKGAGKGESQAEQVETEDETVYADDKEREANNSETVGEEEALQTRGRRATKRDSTVGGRGKKPTSPPSSGRHLSPPSRTKRGTSASSVTSPTPVEERRSSRRAGPKGRGMRDEVVSKSVREQSAAVESVKEEEEAGGEDRPPTRSSRRAKDNLTPQPDISAPLPDQRKGTRRSSTRAGKSPNVDEPLLREI